MDTYNIIDIIKLLLPIIFSPIIYALFRQRVLILNFLWKKFIGKTLSIKNKSIRKVAEQQLDLANIRIMYPGFYFQNIYHAEAIIKWCAKLKIGIDDISGLSREIIYNEHDSPKVKLNDFGIKYYRVLIFTFIVFFGAFTVLAGTAPLLSGVFGGVWLRMNDTNHYVWVDGTKSVRRLTTEEIKPPKFYKENCEKPFSKIYGLTENEINNFCQYFKDEESAKAYEQTTLKKSIWLAAIICPTFSIAFLLYLFSIKRINRVLELSKISHQSNQRKNKLVG